MTETIPDDLRGRLEAAGQSHVLRWWPGLTATERSRLISQLSSVDVPRIRSLWELSQGSTDQHANDSPGERAQRAAPPRDFVPLPTTPEQSAIRQRAAARGDALLRAGRVGVLLVAGGQGTRLQFPHPKGMFPIGPVTGRTLYQWLAEQVLARSRRAGRPIPFYIMTSDATHDETVEFFRAHQWFGLPSSDVAFFRQGTMPVLNLADGRLLMASRGEIVESPDGHGGMVVALQREKLLDDMASRGLEHLYYMQVDNPTAIVCDPEFLGLHADHGSELSTKVVGKRSADERMGVLCDVDGRTQIIEYSDMPDEVAAQTDAAGELVHRLGNTAIHVFSRDLLQRLAEGADELPFHLARKHTPYLDDSERLIDPAADGLPPNGCKFEKFIFDALPKARRTLVVEADRAREFNAVKDKDGANGPVAVREAMSRLFHEWLRNAGIAEEPEARVEISPLTALDAETLRSIDPAELHSRRNRVARCQDGNGSGIVFE